MEEFKAGKVSIRQEGHDLVIVDKNNDHQENAILLTVGHRLTDYPDEYLQKFAEDMVKLWNTQIAEV